MGSHIEQTHYLSYPGKNAAGRQRTLAFITLAVVTGCLISRYIQTNARQALAHEGRTGEDAVRIGSIAAMGARLRQVKLVR